MLLNDIGKSPTATFKRINQHLQSNYGFRISEGSSQEELRAIVETVEDEIYQLKLKGEDANKSPEISKRLLILEGIRSLQESGIFTTSIQSPMFDTVINGMIDFVIDDFSISGTPETAEADFEESVRDAMKQFRSSKFRFPDDVVEQRIREGARERLGMSGKVTVEETPFGFEKRASSLGGHPASVPDTPQARRAMSVLDEPELSLEPMDDNGVAANKGGKAVRNPWDEQNAARKKGILHVKESDKTQEGTQMKENLVKNLRKLLETEVSQAEVMMAAKGFASELQEMIEKIGRLQNEDLPPVTDQMRETYGYQSSSAFQTQIYGALQSVMDALYSAKNQVDDAVGDLAATGQLGATVDMEKDLGTEVDDMMGDEMGDLDVDADLDNIGDEMGDEFGGAEEENPLGREMKAESVNRLEQRVLEMKKLVAKAKKLKEAKAR